MNAVMMAKWKSWCCFSSRLWNTCLIQKNQNPPKPGFFFLK